MSRRRPPANPLRAIGYLRVSTEEQAIGPTAQRHALERWCTQSGVELIAVLEDIGVSGGVGLDRRPGLLSAIDALKREGCGLLLVARRDRLARDTLVAAMVEAAVERAGAKVKSVAGEGTEGSDPTAILMRRIVDAFAEYERLIIRERTRAALGVKARRGERVGMLPYGWAADTAGKLLPVPEEQAVIAQVRAWKEEDVSLREMVRRLQDTRAPCRGQRWHLTTVVRILRRPLGTPANAPASAPAP